MRPITPLITECTCKSGYLRPAGDVERCFVYNMALQRPMEFVEQEPRLQAKLAIKGIHRERVGMVFVGRARSDMGNEQMLFPSRRKDSGESFPKRSGNMPSLSSETAIFIAYPPLFSPRKVGFPQFVYIALWKMLITFPVLGILFNHYLRVSEQCGTQGR